MNNIRYNGKHVNLQWNMHKQQQEDMVATGRHCDWFKEQQTIQITTSSMEPHKYSCEETMTAT
jgi:hypothetical protein